MSTGHNSISFIVTHSVNIVENNDIDDTELVTLEIVVLLLYDVVNCDRLSKMCLLYLSLGNFCSFRNVAIAVRLAVYSYILYFAIGWMYHNASYQHDFKGLLTINHIIYDYMILYIKYW